MKRFAMIATCALCFGLGTLVPVRRTHAQDSTSGHTFYVVDYMKSRLGQDPFKMERDLWKPLHQDRLKNGDILSWAVMRPVLAGPHNYDYITVTAYRSMEAFGKMESAYMSAAEKIWGKDKMQSSMTQTDQARDFLGSEMYVVVDEVNNNTKQRRTSERSGISPAVLDRRSSCLFGNRPGDENRFPRPRSPARLFSTTAVTCGLRARLARVLLSASHSTEVKVFKFSSL